MGEFWGEPIAAGPAILVVHTVDVCAGERCCIHNPSEHPLNQATLNWRGHIMERICRHGVGHPDPDDLAWRARTGQPADPDHGCDGCCTGTVVERRPPVPGVSHTPWTASQVDSLNGYQTSGFGHPYTCPNRDVDIHADELVDRGVLVATADGWRCPDCDYRQGWAHQWAADGSWRQLGGGR